MPDDRVERVLLAYSQRTDFVCAKANLVHHLIDAIDDLRVVINKIEDVKLRRKLQKQQDRLGHVYAKVCQKLQNAK